MIPRAVVIGVILLGFTRALAQLPNDPGLAVAETAAAEQGSAAAARSVTKSAIGTVFGGTQPAAPAAPAAEAPPPVQAVPVVAVVPATDTLPAVVQPPPTDGIGTDGAPPPENAQALAAALAQRGRDPFRPFTLDLRPETNENEILTPLQRFELAQLRLAGVVLNLRPPRAMLQDSSGMGFIITPGTPIGRRRGVVKSIEARRVVVEEHVLDYYGREQVHQVVIEMPRETKPQSAGQE